MPWVVVAVWAAEHADGAPGMVAGVATAPPTGGGAAARGCSSIDIGCTRSFRPATARTLLETVEERVAAPVATGAATLSSTVSSSVLAVAGLNDLVHPMSMLEQPRAAAPPPVGGAVATPATIPGAPSACSAAQTATTTQGITDDEVAQAYGADGLYGAGDLGSGQTVAVYELEPFAITDVSAFDECYFNADHTSNISVTDVDGGAGPGYGTGEAVLDVENISAL